MAEINAKMKLFKFLLPVVIVLLSLTSVFPHGTLVSYSLVTVDGKKVNLNLRIPASELRWKYTLPDDATEIRRRLADAFVVKLDGQSWFPAPTDASVSIDPSNTELIFDARGTLNQPISEIELICLLPEITDPQHTNLAMVQHGERVAQAVLTLEKPRFKLELGGARSVFSQFSQFTRLGVEHIFTGYDHMLFLLALLIVSTTLLGLVKIVSSFTVAHSLTLALATFGVISLPSRFIEAAIALSICYVAAENLIVKEVRKRWVLTSFFGLIHGFGFSNVLREMELPRESLATALFSFNLGVELGQIILVALAFPAVLWVGRRNDLRPRIVLATSSVVAMFGSYWLVLRLFF